MKFEISREAKIVEGHVLDSARAPLLAALRRYDPQLYLKWNAKKRAGLGVWELRRRPEFKTIREGRYVETPRGKTYITGDIFEFEGFTLTVPKYHETSHECVKTFDLLDYRILDWVAKQDLWQYGYKGGKFASESEYREAKFEEKVDEEASAEKDYMLKQYRTQINDFREYVLSGGDPYRLLDYWGK